MTGWIIAGSVLLLFALLLFCPVSLEAVFVEELSVRAGFLFFHYRIWPRPEKEQAPEGKEKPAPGKKPSKIKELLRQKGVSGFLELLRALSRAAYGGARRIFSHTVIWLLHLNLAVGGEDAARTAVNYGKACGLVSTALTALLSAAKYRERNVNVRVTPDFQGGNGSVQFRVLLKIKLFFLFSAVLSALIDMIKIYLKFRKKSGHPDQKEKAVL